MTTKHTPGPWEISDENDAMAALGLTPANWVGIKSKGLTLASTYCQSLEVNRANARLIAAAPELWAALNLAEGYMLNAKIDLETGAPKKTAITTLAGGLRLVRAAIAKAEGGTK